MKIYSAFCINLMPIVRDLGACFASMYVSLNIKTSFDVWTTDAPDLFLHFTEAHTTVTS